MQLTPSNKEILVFLTLIKVHAGNKNYTSVASEPQGIFEFEGSC